MTTYSFTNLSDPSVSVNGSTLPESINDRGQVTGAFDGTITGEGFIYSDGNWTTLTDPSAPPPVGGTSPVSINDRGQVTGSYFNGTTVEGFLYSNGIWTTLTPLTGATSITPVSINDKGQITGPFLKGTNPNDVDGFLYSKGTYTILSDPLTGPGDTIPTSMNDRGQVVGVSFDVGFVYSNGIWTTLSDPSARSNPSTGLGAITTPRSINDRDQVVGTYSNGTSEVGFLYSKGTYTTLIYPFAIVSPNGLTTVPLSINDRGQVAGYYFNGTTDVGFVYSNGTWTTLSDPSAAPGGATNPVSINDKGQITGFYNEGTRLEGFIATPTDVDHKREPPKLTITDHSLSLSAGGTIPLPISVTAYDADDTVSVKISRVPSFDTITAGDGHAVAKSGDSYTFTYTDVQSGLTLHSSFEPKYHPGHDGRKPDRDEGKHSEHRMGTEQTKLTVTAINTTHGEYAAKTPQTITVTNTPPMDRLAGLFNQYVAAGFHNEHDGAGPMTSFSDNQGHQENLAFLSSPHH